MFNFAKALVLKPSPHFVSALSEHQSVANPVDLELLNQQHENYIATLRDAGLEVKILDANPDFPDSPFVEDTHLILPDAIFVLTSGAPSRRGETPYVNRALPKDRPHFRVETCMDGGDILVVNHRIFIGISARTERASIDFVRRTLRETLKLAHLYEVIAVELPAGLHLKSSVTALNDKIFVVTPEIEALNIFQRYGDLIVTDEHEKLGANVLPINDVILIPPRHPKLKAAIEQRIKDKRIIEVDTSEFNKKDGALTCIGLRYS